MPDDHEVMDHCDRCGAIITTGSTWSTVRVDRGPEQVFCQACSDATQRELWDGP